MKRLCLVVPFLLIGCARTAPNTAAAPRNNTMASQAKGLQSLHANEEKTATNTPDDVKPTEAPPEEYVEAYDKKDEGAIQVKGDTGDWFNVFRDGKRANTTELKLNTVFSVSPGDYVVRVNKVDRMVKVAAGKKTVLSTGTLVVDGKIATFYAPFQEKDRKVASTPPRPGSPIALFPGTYRVEANFPGNREVVVAENAKILPGKKTVLQEPKE